MLLFTENSAESARGKSIVGKNGFERKDMTSSDQKKDENGLVCRFQMTKINMLAARLCGG